MSQKFKKAEIYLKDYFSGKMEVAIENRKLELKYPPRRKMLKEQTTMVQSSPSHDQLEREVLNYIDDGTYVFLKQKENAIRKYLEFMKEVDEINYNILELYYKYDKTWNYIEHKLNLSTSACIARRNKAIKELKTWI